MKTKMDKNKLRKILSVVCLVILAAMAFRQALTGPKEVESSSTADGGTGSGIIVLEADESPQTGSPEETASSTPAVLAAEEGSAATAAGNPATDTASSPAAQAVGTAATSPGGGRPAEDGQYTDKDDVALYIHLYGHLPDNFITKAQARALGWGDTYAAVDDAAPGKSIGGDRFGNREGLLPKKAGRSYTECDIGTMGKKSRGAKRIVFSNDGLIYYTGDHYESFQLLYGSE